MKLVGKFVPRRVELFSCIKSNFKELAQDYNTAQWLASLSVVSIISSCHEGVNNVIFNQIMNQESMLQPCELRYNHFPTVHNMHNFQLLPNSLMFHQHFL